MYIDDVSRLTTKIVSTTAVTLSMQSAFDDQYQKSASFSEAFTAAVSAAPLVHAAPSSMWLQVDEARGQLPDVTTEVLLLVNGKMYEGSLEWDHPGHEDTYTAYRYFTDVDGRHAWDLSDVTHWAPKPGIPEGVVRCDEESFVKETAPAIAAAEMFE